MVKSGCFRPLFPAFFYFWVDFLESGALRFKEESQIKILFIGDIVGAAGRKAVAETLPHLVEKFQPHFVIANGENAAGGRGLTQKIANEFFDMGIHCLTMGNHTWDQKEIFNFIDKEERIVRPANYPSGTPGRGYTVVKSGNKELVVINLMGRTYLPPLECPFRTMDDILSQVRKKHRFIFVDFHAEATSEKIAMGWHLDGKVSAVVGTHTHVQTHDETILPNGTAYITDVGMVGSREGVLGMEREAVLQKFKTQLPVRFTADDGKWQFHGVLIEVDEQNGLSKSIQLIRIYENEIIFH